MRYKFRGIPVDRQGNIAQMILPDNSTGNKPFVHGGIFKTQGRIFIVPEKASIEDFDDGFCLLDFIEVHPDTVGQYTGRKVKDDIELCEGDRVLDAVGRTWFVEYNERNAMFLFCWEKDPSQKQPYRKFLKVQRPLVIIGTIHDKENENA